MNAKTETVVAQPLQAEPAIPQLPAAAPRQDIGQVLIDVQAMAAAQKFAEVMAKGVSTVPKHLQGNVADCMAVVLQAMQWGMIPHVVAQKTHLVSGTLGYEAQLVNAVVMKSGAIDGSFSYEFTGSKGAYSCRVGAVLKGGSEITWGEWLSEMEVTTKNSPLWKTNPKQQLGYLQVKNWARLYCPGAILGVYTDDELAGIEPNTPKPVRHMGPAEVVQRNAEQAGDDYTAYEAQTLPFLRDAAVDGMEAMRAAYRTIPKSAFKEKLWATHGVALTTAAEIADEAAAGDGQAGHPEAAAAAGLGDQT